MCTTIVALSSGSLPSGVAVVRLSGPSVRFVLEQMAGGTPDPRRMVLRTITDASGVALDRGLVVFFPGPKSFTGEDCAELHLHGSRAVVDAVLRHLTELDGVELAEPGAFTRRAFENGRLDLTEVEGLGDLIAAQTEGQRQQALARAAGGLREKIATWREDLVAMRAEIEAHLDFSDEDDVPEELSIDFKVRLERLVSQLQGQLATYRAGRIVREGFKVVLAGAPNAGKSSLLNALVRSDLAIVSTEPGTTRDVREVPFDLEGQLVLFYDVAGLRSTQSIAEEEGIRRAKKTLEMADLVLWLRAPDVPSLVPINVNAPLLVVDTKVDLGHSEHATNGDLSVSVRQPETIAALLAEVQSRVRAHVHAEAALVSHLRDKSALEEALAVLEQTRLADSPLEMRAEALRVASAALERWLGVMDSEAVLDRLFAGFCIGK